MSKEKIYIESGKYWITDTALDSSSEEGLALLLDDGSEELFPYIEKELEGKIVHELDIPFKFRKATEEEYKKFYMERGALFIGQEVEIIAKGSAQNGRKYKIIRFCGSRMRDNKGRQTLTHVLFEDGSRYHIKEIKPTCKLIKGTDSFYEFKYGFKVGGAKRSR